MSKAILEQTGKYCYAIFNGEIEKRSHAITHHQDEVEVFTKTGILHKADTIEGIADFFKIPVDNLKATIARVNEFARTGKDLDFNYRSRFVDLSTGPYWIYRGVPSVHHTMGGLKINPKAEVLDADSRPLGCGRSDGLHARHEPPRLERLHRHHRLRPHRGCGSRQIMT